MPIPVFFNLVGVGIVLLAFAAAALVESQVRGSAWMVAGLVMAAGDLIYRNIKSKEGTSRSPFLHPKSGGNIMFIPVWIMGVLAFALGLVGPALGILVYR